MSFKSKTSKKTKKTTSEKKEQYTAPIPSLTLSNIKKILESPTYKANRAILQYNDFITEAKHLLCKLSVEERYNFLNNHLNETKLNKWNDKKNKIMKINKWSFQFTPLSVSWYNFTYAHTSIEASKIWYNFINLIIDFKTGNAECDLKQCQQSDCSGRHLTIIDQLYSFVNTSDESLYAISTQEFTARGGFKLLLKIFNNGGINNPIPPLILYCDEYKKHEFLKHFIEMDYNYLFALSPNEVRFSWIKQMLYNGHPIMSKKEYIHKVLQKFYPTIEKQVVVNTDNSENILFDADDLKLTETDEKEKEIKEYEISKTAKIETATMAEIGVLSWLVATLPNLLIVRQAQKRLLKKEFDKYEETSANLTLIDTMLDYLYWDERYINFQIMNIKNIIMENKNELILFKYIMNEYAGNIAIAMFIKQFIDIHIENNRDTLLVLFNNDTYENNSFYFKLIKQIFNINSMVSKLDSYFPFLLGKIVWTENGKNKINQLLFDNLLSSILSYIERYVSNKSMMMKIVKRMTCSDTFSSNSNDLSKFVNSKREKTKATVLKWIIIILKLLNTGSKVYIQQFIYHLSQLHFKTIYQNETVEGFTLKLFEELIKNKLHIDVVNYFMDTKTHISNELTVCRTECILWLLCRCVFDKAIHIFLFNNKQNKQNDNQIDICKQIQINGKYNNVFLSLSQSRLPDAITNTKRIQNARVNIFKMLCQYAGENNKDSIKKCLLQKDELNGNGKDSLQYSAENNYQSLYNEMKQFIS